MRSTKILFELLLAAAACFVCAAVASHNVVIKGRNVTRN